MAAATPDTTLRRGDGYSHNPGKRLNVKQLQFVLRNRLGYQIDIDGEYGPATEAAIRDVQQRAGIEVDGIVGSKTRRAIIELLSNERSRQRSTGNGGLSDKTIGERIATIAAKYRGQRERPGNSGFVDRHFEAAMRKTGWWKGAAWCDFFAELVWCEAYAGDARMIAILKRTFTGGTLRSFRNFKRAGLFYVNRQPSVGALIYWRHGLTTGHVGIVTGVRTGSSTILTIEGNTNDRGGREGYIVAEKERTLNDRKILGFVHPLEVQL